MRDVKKLRNHWNRQRQLVSYVKNSCLEDYYRILLTFLEGTRDIKMNIKVILY